MASVFVTVTPKSGLPRSMRMDDFRDPKTGAEVRGGASLIETLRKREQRGELLSVVVAPAPTIEAAPDETPAPAKRAAKKAAEAPAEA